MECDTNGFTLSSFACKGRLTNENAALIWGTFPLANFFLKLLGHFLCYIPQKIQNVNFFQKGVGGVDPKAYI